MDDRDQLVKEAEGFLYLADSESDPHDAVDLSRALSIIHRLLFLLPKEGEVVVSVEPTNDMNIAGLEELLKMEGNIVARRVYKAMIEARPQ